MSQSSGHLVWMDLEMTGLEPEHDTILEIATLITDAQLNVIATGPNLVIHQPDPVLAAMDAWNQKHHGESGLIERVRASQVTMAEAQQRTLAFIRTYVRERESPLCGNSVHQDRRFLHKYMLELHDFLHYRNVDVSTIKELAKRWYPKHQMPYKKSAHQALDDIMASVEELRHYREHLFIR